MSFDWAAFLRVAEMLQGASDTDSPDRNEAYLRTAVSRAYYAVYCQARNRLRDIEGIRIPVGASAHLVVRNRYEEADDPRHAEIGVHLRLLRYDRNRCDYDDKVSNLREIVGDSLARAGAALDLLERL